MSFILPELPYAYDALEPYMDALTTEIHHDKHHAGYTKNLNAALEKYPEFFDKSIEEILTDLNSCPKKIRTAVRNNGVCYYHHNYGGSNWDLTRVANQTVNWQMLSKKNSAISNLSSKRLIVLP
jgi:superoxide dismutase